MRFSAASVVAMASAASAVAVSNSTTPATNGTAAGPTTLSCQGSYNLCEQSGESRCDSGLTACQQDCYSTYNTCRSGANANMAACASAYASCLGTNPFAANGTNTITPGAFGAGAASATAGGIAYTTEVVTAFTTVCPGNGAITYNGQTYTNAGPSSTTITITNCPCTITKALSSVPATGAATTPAQATATGNSSNPYKPETFTGAGSQLLVGGSSLIAAIAGLAFFL